MQTRVTKKRTERAIEGERDRDMVDMVREGLEEISRKRDVEKKGSRESDRERKKHRKAERERQGEERREIKMEKEKYCLVIWRKIAINMISET